jgi:hypothetical protein
VTNARVRETPTRITRSLDAVAAFCGTLDRTYCEEVNDGDPGRLVRADECVEHPFSGYERIDRRGACRRRTRALRGWAQFFTQWFDTAYPSGGGSNRPQLTGQPHASMPFFSSGTTCADSTAPVTKLAGAASGGQLGITLIATDSPATVSATNGNVGRCAITQRHPESGVKDLDTLKALATYRRHLDTTEELAFGVYGEVLTSGKVRVGDAVTLI